MNEPGLVDVQPGVIHSSNPKSGPASKSTVIVVTVVSTVLVLALITVGVFFFLRKRRRNSGGQHHRNVKPSDRGVDNTNDFTSKTPLMRQEELSQTDYRASPTPRYDEENEVDISTSQTRRRSFSGVSMQSLPPSYSVGIHEANETPGKPATRNVSHNRHNRHSSVGGSDGLRPLMLVTAQKDQDDEEDISEQRGRSQQSSSSNRSSLIAGLSVGRPRASSRFREEEMDM